MDQKDLDLKLLAAEPIDIGIGKIHHLTLREIIRMGENEYYDKLKYLIVGKESIEGATGKDVSDYEIFLVLGCVDEYFRQKCIETIELLFKEKADFNLDENDPFFYLGDDKDRKIDEEKLNLIKMIIKKANFIDDKKEEEDYNPGNEKARLFIEKLKKKKAMVNKKETMNLYSITNGLAWKSESVNIFNVFDLTVYQLYVGFQTHETIDNYRYTLQGIYSGTVDGKNIKFDQIHWAKLQQNKI